MHCDQCMSGHHNRCASNEGLIVGRYGGFADAVRCHWAWTTKLPEGFDLREGGPLFCGGITVFQPIVQHAIRPTARVGVFRAAGGADPARIGFRDRDRLARSRSCHSC